VGSARILELEHLGSLTALAAEVETMFILVAKWCPAGGNQLSDYAGSHKCQQHDKDGHHDFRRSTGDATPAKGTDQLNGRGSVS